jgi:hypothetical protein
VSRRLRKGKAWMTKERKKSRKASATATEPDTSLGTKQITVPFQADLLEEAGKAAVRMSKGGMRVAPTDILRAAVFRGLPLIEDDGLASMRSTNGEALRLKQQTLYLNVDHIDSAKRLAERLSVSGLKVTHMAVLRMAVAMGLPLVEKDGALGSPADWK